MLPSPQCVQTSLPPHPVLYDSSLSNLTAYCSLHQIHNKNYSTIKRLALFLKRVDTNDPTGEMVRHILRMSNNLLQRLPTTLLEGDPSFDVPTRKRTACGCFQSTEGSFPATRSLAAHYGLSQEAIVLWLAFFLATKFEGNGTVTEMAFPRLYLLRSNAVWEADPHCFQTTMSAELEILSYLDWNLQARPPAPRADPLSCLPFRKRSWSQMIWNPPPAPVSALLEILTRHPELFSERWLDAIRKTTEVNRNLSLVKSARDWDGLSLALLHHE